MGVSPRWAAPPEISAWGLWHWPNPYMLVAAAWGLHSSAPAFAPPQLYEMQRAAMRLGDTELCWVDAGSQLGLGKMQRELTAISWQRPSVPATDTGPCLHPSSHSVPQMNTSLFSQWPKPPPHCKHWATGFTNGLCPCEAGAFITKKHFAMRNPKAGKGPSVGLPESM